MKFQISNKIDFFDQQILLSFQQLRRRPMDHFFLIVTYTGTGYAWLTFAIVLNILHSQDINFVENQTGFMRALFSPLLAWASGSVLKKLVSRERPSIVIDGYKKLIKPPACSSFPSVHTAASVSFFVALTYLAHPLTALIGAWAIVISLSRLYLGVHYLSDILGGIVLGILSAMEVRFIFNSGYF